MVRICEPRNLRADADIITCHFSAIFSGSWFGRCLRYFQAMSSLQQVEQAVLKLSAREQEELRDWLENILEDRLEMTEAFKDEIAAGKADIAAGRVRVRRP